MILLILGLSEFTNYRMNSYGTYDLIYANTIGYTGPEWSLF